MRTRLSVLFFFIFLSSHSFAQDSSPKRTKSQDTLPKRKVTYESALFIKGTQAIQQQTIDIDVIKNGFEFDVSDSSVSILQYTVCWDIWNTIVCVEGKEKFFPAERKEYSLNELKPPMLLTIDNISVLKDGKKYRIPSLVYYVEDLHNKYLSLKNPMICHDKELRPVCYNDGTYIFNFEKSRFAGFILADSTVFYNEKEKKLTINKPGWIDTSHFKPITIKLEAASLLCTYGGNIIAPENMNGIFSKIDNLNFNMKTGKFSDTINFKAGERNFTIEISKNEFEKPARSRRWKITEKHDASIFQLQYQWRFNNPRYIFISDDRLKYGLSISNSFKTGKKIWQIESYYVDEINGVITKKPEVQQYSYMYDKSGKLNNKKSIGAVNFCNCQ